jgi:hypothetical protein
MRIAEIQLYNDDGTPAPNDLPLGDITLRLGNSGSESGVLVGGQMLKGVRSAALTVHATAMPTLSLTMNGTLTFPEPAPETTTPTRRRKKD